MVEKISSLTIGASLDTSRYEVGARGHVRKPRYYGLQPAGRSRSHTKAVKQKVKIGF
jgi:hypothetical protein